MTDLAKLLAVLNVIDEMETYIKVLAFNFKINEQDARELLNYIKKANDLL